MNVLAAGQSPGPGVQTTQGSAMQCAPNRVHGRQALFAWSLACGLPALPLCAAAQSVESDLTPESATLARDSSRYFFPDIRDEVLEITNYLGEHEQFAIKFGLMVLPADYTSFTRDDASKQQVGNQCDQFEVRALRLMARGNFCDLGVTWRYMDYQMESGKAIDNVNFNGPALGATFRW
jgi:hypothetical protein